MSLFMTNKNLTLKHFSLVSSMSLFVLFQVGSKREGTTVTLWEHWERIHFTEEALYWDRAENVSPKLADSSLLFTQFSPLHWSDIKWRCGFEMSFAWKPLIIYIVSYGALYIILKVIIISTKIKYWFYLCWLSGRVIQWCEYRGFQNILVIYLIDLSER